jgi:hypothetical protein
VNRIWHVGARVKDKISGREGVIIHVFGDYIVVKYSDGMEVQLPRHRFVVIE